MAKLTALLLACLCGTSSAQCAVKLGGVLKDTGFGPGAKKAFELAQSWAADNKADKYSLDLTGVSTWTDEATMITDIQTATAAGSTIHAVVCPYTSGLSKKCVDAVDASFKGPILVWGGAADTIFTTNCVNKNCFGTFTPASHYLKSGIDAVDSKSAEVIKTVLIVNNNTFSMSVLAGAKTEIEALGASKMTIVDEVHLSVKGAMPSAADLTAIDEAMKKNPELEIVVGHPKDVEPTIVEVGAHNHTPMAVLGINSVGGTYSDTKYQKCVVMPTQWDSTSTHKDPVIGWDSAAFTKAITDAGLTATYHVASAGGSAVGLINAIGNATGDCTGEVISTNMKALDIDSFYGKLKWNANGAIQKEMYMVQTSTDNYITKETFKAPLSSAECWDTASAGGSDDGGLGGKVAGAAAMTLSGVIIALMSALIA